MPPSGEESKPDARGVRGKITDRAIERKRPAAPRKYTEEFKLRAVTMSQTLGIRPTARELGITATVLMNWRRRAAVVARRLELNLPEPVVSEGAKPFFLRTPEERVDKDRFEVGALAIKLLRRRLKGETDKINITTTQLLDIAKMYAPPTDMTPKETNPAADRTQGEKITIAINLIATAKKRALLTANVADVTDDSTDNQTSADRREDGSEGAGEPGLGGSGEPDAGDVIDVEFVGD